MNEPYRDFTELTLNTTKDKDYHFVILNREAEVTIVAIHGGGIDPLTSELAAAIAGEEHNLYDFRGIRPEGNEQLRISPRRYDEVRLRGLLDRSRLAMSLIGDASPGQDTCVGGANRRLRALLGEMLPAAGFAVCPPSGPGLSHDPTRFYNRPSQGGVQLELPLALRQEMLLGPLERFRWEDASQWTERFHAFIAAVRQALAQYQAEQRADLTVAQERFEKTTKLVRKIISDHRNNGHE